MKFHSERMGLAGGTQKSDLSLKTGEEASIGPVVWPLEEFKGSSLSSQDTEAVGWSLPWKSRRLVGWLVTLVVAPTGIGQRGHGFSSYPPIVDEQTSAEVRGGLRMPGCCKRLPQLSGESGPDQVTGWGHAPPKREATPSTVAPQEEATDEYPTGNHSPALLVSPPP